MLGMCFVLQQVGPRRARGLCFVADETWCVRYVLDVLSTIRLGVRGCDGGGGPPFVGQPKVIYIPHPQV